MPSVQLKNNYMSKTMKFLIKMLYPFASKIVAQTKYMKKEIADIYKIDENKVIVINNPLDKKYIESSLKNKINPFKNNTDKYNFVYVGRLSDEKNPLFLIDVFEKVVQKDKRFYLTIIGDGYLYEDVKKRINEKSLEQNIILLGFQKNPYIKYADGVLLWEGMPNVVIESLYLHTPVITTNSTPVLKDLIIEGENGFIIDGFDKDKFTQSILDIKTIKNKFLEVENFDFNKFFTEIVR